ncbi:MAG: L,D-transpeptidase family protein [Clostridiales bacterium]|nr:L,D-transpeptidase family protein [Clostridiales bacterium]
MRGTSKKLFSFILTVVAIVFCLFCFKVSVHADGSLSDVSSDSNKENVEAENTIDVLVESNSKQLVDDTNKDLLKDDNKGSNDKAESNSTSQDSHIDSNSTRSSGQERIEKSADGKLYYIDSSGKRKTSAGWIYFDGKKYFASPGGSLYTNQMITFGSYGYYMGSDGSVVLGHFRGADGVYRYADAIGNLEDESYGKLAASGWREDNYFAHGGYGALYHNQFITFGEKIYYMNTDGSKVKTPFRYRWANIKPNPTTGLISKADYNRAVNTGPYPYQRYVLVNLSKQNVQLWVNGRMVSSSLVVTGKPSTPTPRGTFSILYKTTNTYLTGPGYHLHVNYWMPFTHQGHGLHDAYWLRSNQFGGNTYRIGWGSHGCVNMPNSAAQTFYRYLSAGDRVIII